MINEVANELTFEKFQELTHSTAVYPEVGTQSLSAVSYCALGLAGEAGEVANKVKKLLRDGDSPEKRAEIVKEVADCMWYIPELLNELGEYGMGDTALLLILKLQGRAQRGTLQGNGDER
jgi:NTP pyrophosphatase (non-canonical NTP hydrolase)